MSKSTRPYEAVIIMKPDASEETQKALFKKNKEIIAAHTGSVHHVDTWGKRDLANDIAKCRKGIFFHSTFTGDANCVAELERTMRINDNVLRFVHTRLPDETNLVQFMEKFKNDLAEGLAREKDREAKFQQKKAARAAQFQNN